MTAKKPKVSKVTKQLGVVCALIGFAATIFGGGYKAGNWFLQPYIDDYQNTKKEIHETAGSLKELRATTQTRTVLRDTQLAAIQTWANGQNIRLDRIDQTIKENHADLEQKMKDAHDETHRDINHLIDLIEKRPVVMREAQP